MKRPLQQSSSSISHDRDDDDASMMDLLTKSGGNQQQSLLDEKKREYDRIKADLMKSKRAVRVMTGEEAAAEAKNSVVSTLEQRRQK